MSSRSSVVLGRVLVIVLLLFGVAGVGLFFYFQSKTPTFVVTFSESEPLFAGSSVMLNGVPVGEVLFVKPAGTGVSVGIKITREYLSGFTESSRFFVEDSAQRLLVKNLKSSARPLIEGQVVEGTTSRLQWSTYDVARDWNNFFESKEFLDAQSAMQNFFEETDRGIQQFSRDIQEPLNEFFKQMEKTFSDENIETFQKDLNESFTKAQAALSRAQNSEEALKLKKEMDALYQKIQEALEPQSQPAPRPAS